MARCARALRRRLLRWRWSAQVRQWRRQRIDADLIDPATCTLVGGVDISFVKDSETEACAALVVLSLPSLEVVYEAYARVELDLPYIPGYLAFREARSLLDLLAELRRAKPHLFPHLVLVDGNGILHPQKFGLACHLGVRGKVATVGVAKNLFVIDGLTRDGVRAAAAEACAASGDSCPLVGASGFTWGAALRTTDGEGFNPVYVSAGHGLTLESSLELVRRCCRHRVPEPVRQADLRSRERLRDDAGCS